jgi:hypothetical protein
MGVMQARKAFSVALTVITYITFITGRAVTNVL